jgi:hypothetical protein
LFSQKRFLRFDAKKWEKDYNPKVPLDGLPKDPYNRPNPKSNIDPFFDPGKDARKAEHIQNLRWQLREGVWTNDALPRLRDQNDPLKPFIPQIPLMEDTPFTMQKPTPIWETLRPTPKFRDFIGHYLPNKVKIRRTKALFNEYLKGPLDVLDPKYKKFFYHFFGPKSLLFYTLCGLAALYTFEIGLLWSTELEEMFEITAKNLIRSESFIVTANTVQEMVNLGLLDPSLSVLETKIFLEETLNVGYAYNSQVLKDLSYLMNGFHKAIDLTHPNQTDPNSALHIDHFSQTDTDISYLPLERYLSSFEHFFEVYYTKDIDMISLATREEYNPSVTSPRQVFFAKIRDLWLQFVTPIRLKRDEFISYFNLLPQNERAVHNGGINTTMKRIKAGDENKVGSAGEFLNSDQFATKYAHSLQSGPNSIDERIRIAELHNVDFSQTATLQFNPNIGKIVDFYFEEIPNNFSFSEDVFFALKNPDEAAALRREQYINAKLHGLSLPIIHTNEHANPLLLKDPNISYNTDHKHRFLSDSFLPTHLQAFKSAYLQTRSIHNVGQLMEESNSIKFYQDDPNNAENSPLATLYKQYGVFEQEQRHQEVIDKYNQLVSSNNQNLSTPFPFSLSSHPLMTVPGSYTPSIWNMYGLGYSLQNLAVDYYHNHDNYFYNTHINADGTQNEDDALTFLGKSTYNGLLHTLDYGINGSYYLYNGVLGSLLPYVIDTIFTDERYIQKRKEQISFDQNEQNNQIKQEIDNSNQYKLTDEFGPKIQTQIPKIDDRIYSPLQHLTKGDKSYLERNKQLNLMSTARHLTTKERLEKIKKNAENFNAEGFNQSFNDVARSDYIDMLLRYIDMLLHMRTLFSDLANRVNMNIDDFKPDYGTITTQFERTPYLLAYYNYVLRDLAPLTQENQYFPLLPTNYQYNDIKNKGLRTLQTRIKREEDHRMGQFYRKQILNNTMGLQNVVLRDPNGEIINPDQNGPKFDKKSILSILQNSTHGGAQDPFGNIKNLLPVALTSTMSPEMIAKFNIDNMSNKPRPIYQLDKVVNRFQDDPDKVTPLQNQLGRVVTKLDLCLLQTFAEIERQKSVFDVTLPPYIHVNTDLLLQDERFAFDLIYQQEEEVRRKKISKFSPHAGKTLDWFSQQEQSHAPFAQQPYRNPDEMAVALKHQRHQDFLKEQEAMGREMNATQ